MTDVGIEASIWLAQDGSARADELAAALGIVDPPAIERIELELLDEAHAGGSRAERRRLSRKRGRWRGGLPDPSHHARA